MRNLWDSLIHWSIHSFIYPSSHLSVYFVHSSVNQKNRLNLNKFAVTVDSCNNIPLLSGCLFLFSFVFTYSAFFFFPIISFKSLTFFFEFSLSQFTQSIFFFFGFFARLHLCVSKASRFLQIRIHCMLNYKLCAICCCFFFFREELHRFFSLCCHSFVVINCYAIF